MGKALWTQLPSYLAANELAHRRKISYGRAKEIVKRAGGFKKQIKPRTKKRAAEERAYRARVKLWLVGKVSPISGKPATQCHHRFGRRGRLLLWESGWIPVTAADHLWIDSHRAEAQAKGLLCPAGMYDDYERAVEYIAAENKITPLNCLVTAKILLDQMP